MGDIKENADYDAAKNEQGLNEARVRQLEQMLRTSSSSRARAETVRPARSSRS